MKNIDYKEFEKAVNTLGLIGIENRTELKEMYLKKSKKYHPDTPNGSTEKFQEINEAYELLTRYVDNFKFSYSKEEFKDQYPFSITENGYSIHKTM